MVQRPVRPPLPSLLLDSTAAMPRIRQLYEGWRHAILAGQFAPGTKLPSTRAVAEHLGVSRNTVYLAFEHLRSEGYVEGRQGAGTYVAQVLPEALLTLPPSASPVITQPPGNRAVSQRSARLLGTVQQPPWHDRPPATAFRVLPA
jgi:GntR family transcriptional regulator / MocR family aminotransferase